MPNSELINGHREPTPQDETDVRIAKLEAQVAALEAQLEQAKTKHAEALRLAATDPLTGLDNRRTLTEKIRYELSRVGRYGTSLTLAMVDLDPRPF